MVKLDGMRSADADAFRKTAGWFKLFLLVRATNPASLPYMSQARYAAKRLDCKAKTADLDVLIDGRLYKTAGLVVSPRLVGEAAFRGDKYKKALKEWEKFEPKVTPVGPAGRQGLTYFPNGGVYGLQTDRASNHYGCVLFSTSSLVTAASYVHGDYDLYAIVDPGDPRSTVFVTEKRLGETHARSKELTDVQTFVNRELGRPMVLHGDQEKYAPHSDEEVYAFFPDGKTVEVLQGRAAIEGFYATRLSGRKTGGDGVRTVEAGGLWRKVG